MKVLLLLLALLVPSPSSSSSPTEPTGREVLAAWDDARSAAWADGDVRRLEALYTDGSVAGERDVAMLRRWLDRERTVTGIRMQVLSVREVSRSDERLVLDVVDRVVGAASDGVALPIDGPTSHHLVLRRVDGEWLVSSVR